jgi:hypothetical protein
MISCILSDNNRIKLEINSNKNYRKQSNKLRQINMLLNSQLLTVEVEVN